MTSLADYAIQPDTMTYNDADAVQNLIDHGLPSTVHIERNASLISIVWPTGGQRFSIDYTIGTAIAPSPSGLQFGSNLTQQHLVPAVVSGGTPATVAALLPTNTAVPAAQQAARATIQASAAKSTRSTH